MAQDTPYRRFLPEARCRIGFAVGTILVVAGLFLAIKSGSLATHWQPLGEGAWGGTTDPAAVRGYQIVGGVLLGAGLLVGGLAWFTWSLSSTLQSRSRTANTLPADNLPEMRP